MAAMASDRDAQKCIYVYQLFASARMESIRLQDESNAAGQTETGNAKKSVESAKMMAMVAEALVEWDNKGPEENEGVVEDAL